MGCGYAAEMTGASEPRSPFQLPPGPERRELMRAMNLNTGRDDYADDEWAMLEAQVAARRAARGA